jgi:D-psicose/D-tagatose/L-ribulose 3-epimerase
VKYLRSLAGMAAELGGSVVTVVPTTVGQVVPEAAADREWAWVVEGLQAVEQETRALGIALAIEPLNRFETYLVNYTSLSRRTAETLLPLLAGGEPHGSPGPA